MYKFLFGSRIGSFALGFESLQFPSQGQGATWTSLEKETSLDLRSRLERGRVYVFERLNNSLSTPADVIVWSRGNLGDPH